MRSVFPSLALLLLLGSPGLHAQLYTFEGAIATGWRGASTNSLYSVAGVLGGHATGTSSGAGFSVEGGTVSFEPSLSAPSLPPLSVHRTGQTMEISWASNAGLALLQETPSLDGADWSDASVTPSQVNGRWVVTVGVSTGRRFFRLTSAAPTLTVKRSGATLQVSWTSADRGFVLQESANLAAPAAWSDLPTSPVLIDGRWVVALPFQSNPRFLRLRRP